MTATPPASFDRTAMLQSAIGRTVRDIRHRYDLSGVELAKASGISPAMLSRIERGAVSPSLDTLQALASSLGIPMTELLGGYRDESRAMFFRSDGELDQASSSCRLKWDHQTTAVSFIHLSEPAQPMPMPQHPGPRFLHALEGTFVYRHGAQRYRMTTGDSLLCDAAPSQEIEYLIAAPVRAVSLVSYR